MGRIIAFANQKGGAGKTSGCVMFSWWVRHQQSKTITVVDSDAQQSCLTWLKSIDKDFPVVSVTNPDDVMEKARLLADQNDFVVIDGPGQVSELNRTILLVADVAVIPCQPAGLDLHSTHGVFRLVRSSQQVRGGKPTAVCYLSRAVPNTRLKNETAAALSQIERVKYLPFVIHHRQVITDCFGQEASLWTLTEKEAKRSAKTPIREYEALFQAILEESYE